MPQGAHLGPVLGALRSSTSQLRVGRALVFGRFAWEGWPFLQIAVMNGFFGSVRIPAALGCFWEASSSILAPFWEAKSV